MKIERTNDDQVRYALTNFDSSVRNINLVELAYDTGKVRKLFHKMIQEASNETGFEAEGIPLMMEAVPLSSGNIMLVITRAEDPEELDTRFAKFSPFTEKNQDSLLSQLANESLEGARDSLGYLEPNAVEEAQSKMDSASQGSKTAKKGTGTVGSRRIFRLDSLDRISGASKAVEGIYTDVNSLCKKPGTRQYYLVVKRQDCTDLDFSRVYGILAGYIAELPDEGTSGAYFKEYYEVMIQDQTLQSLAGI